MSFHAQKSEVIWQYGTRHEFVVELALQKFYILLRCFWPRFHNLCLEPESGVAHLEEDGKPEDRVELALKCLPHYDPDETWIADSIASFCYWKIRDYAYAYRSKLTTPSIVSEFNWYDCIYSSLIHYFQEINSLSRLLSGSLQQSGSSTIRIHQHHY